MELELAVILGLVGLLNVAAWRWGVDSRDGRDWQPRREYAGMPQAGASAPHRSARAGGLRAPRVEGRGVYATAATRETLCQRLG